MHLFIESYIGGSLSEISKRYAEAHNKYMTKARALVYISTSRFKMDGNNGCMFD
jgi:hypothetical protein